MVVSENCDFCLEQNNICSNFCSPKLGPFTIQPAHFYFLIMRIYCLQRNDTKYYVILERHTQNNADCCQGPLRGGQGVRSTEAQPVLRGPPAIAQTFFLEIVYPWAETKVDKGPGGKSLPRGPDLLSMALLLPKPCHFLFESRMK